MADDGAFELFGGAAILLIDEVGVGSEAHDGTVDGGVAGKADDVFHGCGVFPVFGSCGSKQEKRIGLAGGRRRFVRDLGEGVEFLLESGAFWVGVDGRTHLDVLASEGMCSADAGIFEDGPEVWVSGKIGIDDLLNFFVEGGGEGIFQGVCFAGAAGILGGCRIHSFSGFL